MPSPASASASSPRPVSEDFLQPDDEEGQLGVSTKADYRWCQEKHLPGFFGTMPLDSINAETVEQDIAKKLADEKLSPRSINMTVVLLGAFLESA
jgi:hypothetical protein